MIIYSPTCCWKIILVMLKHSFFQILKMRKIVPLPKSEGISGDSNVAGAGAFCKGYWLGRRKFLRVW